MLPPEMMNGVIIGLLSSFGSAILIALVFLIVYFVLYTPSGRILLDRFGRPGEYDDEQAFAREEAEALETMDDMQRTEYLRAKGMKSKLSYRVAWHSNTDASSQHSFKATRPSPSKRIFHCHNILPFKRREFQHGSLSRNSRSPTVSSRPGRRSSSLTPNVP